MRFPRLLPLLATAALAAAMALPGTFALAQDAPPHEGEAAARRPQAKARHAAPAPQKGKPAAHDAKAVSKPGAKPAAKPGAKPGPKTAEAKAAAKAKRDAKPLHSLDANHDGRITKAEYMKPAKKRFSKADANRDGVVSPKEAADFKAKQLKNEERLDRKRAAEGKPPRKHRKSTRPPKPYLSTFDADKDGRVTQKEYLARREKKFTEMDANHDGVVSRAEALAYKQNAKQRREERAAKAKEHRLRKIEEAKAALGASSTGPELTAPVTPPPAPKIPAQQKASPGGADQGPAAKPVPEGKAPQQDLPLTPIAPEVPAKAEPAT